MAASVALQVVVAPFLEVVFDNLSSLIRNEVGLQWGVDKEMRKLKSTLSTIRDVLEEAEENQLTNKPIVNWLQKLKDVAYDADDVLDLWATKAMELESNQVCDSLLTCMSFEQIIFRRKTAKQINELLEKFDVIADERHKFHLRKDDVARKVDVDQIRETSSIITETRIYGRDEEKELVMELLLNNASSEEDLSVCPILGMGGLGKTTLAQLVYNDERVKEHFEVRVWVCVSDDFDLKRLTRAILDSVSGDGASSVADLDLLQRSVQEKLGGKRFLLVLDDVWNENQEQWTRLKGSLRCGAKGSSVVVTTRLQAVASITGTFPPCSLTYLSKDDCWLLFKQCAFEMGNKESSNLAKIGKQIVGKCGGVPLAAKVLGGLMRFKDGEREWTIVRDSNIWHLPQSDENAILPALMLSYTHLSPVMRQCFAYCSIFPKDYEMSKEDVIQLWIANGLIQSKDGFHEETGNEIYNALVRRSFFHHDNIHDMPTLFTRRSNRLFTMHDLIHDLACSITVNECYRIEEYHQIINIREGTRHLSVSKNKSSDIMSMDKFGPRLRTFLSFKYFNLTVVDLSSFACIRALSYESKDFTSLPDSVGNLKHLRYLNLSGTRITSLPISICKLRNLQTLKLGRCYALQTLPKRLGSIISLRHLEIYDCSKIEKMPIGMGRLTFLRTLSIFIVGSDDGRHIKELKGLDQLSGEIHIKGLEHVQSSSDAKEANLMRRQNLLSLELTWSRSHLEDGNDRDILQELQPHSNIKRLTLYNYKGLAFPSWLDASSLPNLVEISFIGCTRCEQLPLLSKLPVLKFLTIRRVHNVKFFLNSNDSGNGFPSLEELHIYEMPALEEWSSSSIAGNTSGGEQEQLVCFPSLKHLDIRKCPQLKTIPFLQCSSRPHLSLVFLQIEACPKLDLSTVKFQHLVALEHLYIIDIPDVTSLPDRIQHLSSTLTFLRLLGLSSLMVLPDWIGSLTSLRKLTICKCENLKELPQGLKHLSNLYDIDISACHPDLKRRCSRETGEDWHKIAHIPIIWIDGQRVVRRIKNQQQRKKHVD